ncbi:Stk1 family PASTA domain-containing Ser/Thr kinase [Olsenella sp. An188]|uniref:Stk1 family PASTA domain-containing Ser/Thr kinase n=1 Tax=Olsenella sp. An188 TaxID=1965579 RepID=UPI000B399280|nr:Stk1 family PASTA domain-containing Ser/Thr kinase [Olsenella sp. An188]OUP38047.1 serine/threonine protein kinase [Olsenella sp. An188]HJB54892.1 Stk1 family PASTA domain-containing Ser/Thr kinase [Candidatus Olsenella avistercoris]
MSAMMLGGRYQVQDKIGAGGMATVYRGLDEVLGRTVAIKTMLPQYANDPSFAARFKQEAQAAAALQSPYIVSVYDWGKDADTYYIVMEYLRGTDLKSGIRKHGALDCKKVAQIGSQIAQALSVAHRHDIIHRDIKPQNIMVQPDGNIKVMDFGIARAKNSHLTQDNSVLGTAHYVSPEQTQGKELGPTTDIYSLGIVMYEAATGQVPFQGDDAISVALKQVNEQPKPPSQLNPAVDPSLESIILKCMQKNPAERFQTADELYRTLRDYLAGRMQAVNSATAMLPAQPTNKLDRGAGTIPAAGGTASMPRVERANRYRGQSATEQAAEQEAERQRKRRRNIILGVIGGIAVLAVVIFAVTSLLGSGTTMRTVPNLITLTQDEAIEEIEAAGFVAGTPEEVYSSSYPEGQVCEQDPRAYREMPEGSTINFKVSKGEEPVEQTSVPDLTNKTEEEAQALLAEANLKGRAGEEREDANIEQGLICDQDYDPGSSVDVGTTITYYVSSGSGQEVIPNVEGDDESTARSRLESAGFVVSSQTSNSDTVAEGHVIYTTPGVGETADVGSTVTIYVSSGPAAPKEYDVQYVVGWTYAEAYAALTNQGFSPVLATGNSAEGIVSSQSVTGTAPKGAEIVLTTRTPDTGSGDGEGTDGETEGNGAQGITGLSANTGA